MSLGELVVYLLVVLLVAWGVKVAMVDVFDWGIRRAVVSRGKEEAYRLTAIALETIADDLPNDGNYEDVDGMLRDLAHACRLEALSMSND